MLGEAESFRYLQTVKSIPLSNETTPYCEPQPSSKGELNITMTLVSVSSKVDCIKATFAQQMMPNGVCFVNVLQNVEKKCIYSSAWVYPLEVQQHLRIHVLNLQLCV